jgi:hypothetical protein
MPCRRYDLKASGENSCVTVNSREGERINVFEERSMNDDLLEPSLCTMSMRDPQALTKLFKEDAMPFVNKEW